MVPFQERTHDRDGTAGPADGRGAAGCRSATGRARAGNRDLPGDGISGGACSRLRGWAASQLLPAGYAAGRRGNLGSPAAGRQPGLAARDKAGDSVTETILAAYQTSGPADHIAGLRHGFRAACPLARPGHFRCLALYRPQTGVNTAIAALIVGIYGLAGNAATAGSPAHLYRNASRLFDVTAGNNALAGTPEAACGNDYLCTAKKAMTPPPGSAHPAEPVRSEAARAPRRLRRQRRTG